MNIVIPIIIFIAISPLEVISDDSGFALSNPIGIVRTSISASKDGLTPAATLWAPTLFHQAQLQGAMIGKITSANNATITVNKANWKTNQLVGAYIYIQSGPLSGAMLNILSNTDKTLTIDNQTPAFFGSGLGANNGFQIIQPDTLLSILGTPTDGVVGGTFEDFKNNKTDRVMIRDESAKFIQTYYYDLTAKYWRDAVSNQSRNNLTISPLAGAIYYRIGKSAMELTFTGNVPTNGGRFLIPEGVASHSRFFPIRSTLNGLGLQALPQWRKSNAVNENLADRLMVQGGDGIIRTYWHNGINWVTAGSSLNQNNTSIQEGASFFTVRSGNNPPAVFSMPQPY